jgi:O-antigen/teichoic acid export membrane protein
MRSGRSVLNFGSSVAFTAITLVTGLFATPLLLAWLGEERFGAFRAASEWWGYLTLLELGTGGALLAMLAEASGRRDAPLTRDIVVVAIRRYGRIALLATAGGLLLAAAMPHLVRVRPDLVGDLRTGCFIALLGVVTLPLAAPFRVLAESHQRGYVVNALLTVQALVVTGLALLLAWSGWGIRGQFLAFALGGLPYALGLAWLGRAAHPGVVRAAVVGPDAPDARLRLRRLDGPTLVCDVASRVSLLSDSIVLALVLGPAAVVPVFATQRLAVLAQGQLQGIGTASWAALAELHHQGERGRFNARVVELTRLVAVLGVACLVPIAVYGERFVTLWVGAERYAGHGVAVVAAVNAYLLAAVSLWGWCLTGTGRVRRLAGPSLVQAVVNVAASIAFTRWLGLVGPVLGTLVGLASVGVWYLPRLLEREFGTSARALYGALALPAAVGVPYALALRWVGATHAPTGWLGLAVHLAAATLIVLAFWWLVMLRGAERTALRARAGVMWRRPAT